MSKEAKKDIEEGTQVYRLGGFHPVYIGDVFNDRYKVLNRIGYGVYSTVWLVEDLESTQLENKYRALKILRADCYDGKDAPIFEREILTHFRNGDREQLGYKHVCHLAYGRDTAQLRHLVPRMQDSEFGDAEFTIQLLLALDFAHEHNVVHTDIKPDNIFVKFRDYSLIESGYLVEVAIPQQDKSEEQYSVIPLSPLYCYYFNEADKTRVAEFDIALGDWGVSSWADQHLTELIQPVALRSPEVLIQAPWGARTDWWNLGSIILELFQAVRMFSGLVPPDGHYELKEHLAEIVDLSGPFPRELLEQGNQDIVRDLFDEDGRIKDYPPMGRPGLSSEEFLSGLDQSVRVEFASFLHTMMKINPKDRISAEDLLRHPWLGALPPNDD